MQNTCYYYEEGSVKDRMYQKWFVKFLPIDIMLANTLRLSRSFYLFIY